MHFLLRWLLGALALFVTVKAGQALGLPFYIAPGSVGIEALLLMTALLGIINAVVRPIVQLIALPLTCLTFGLFGFVINALLFWLAGQFVPGFHVRGFIAPLFGSIIMGLISGALSIFIVPRGERNE